MPSRPPRSAPIHGVLYDHDGTLVNSLPVVVAATNRALREHGHAEDAGAAIIAAMVLPTAPRMGHHSGVTDGAGQSRLAHAFYRIARELAGLASLYPGVPELLAAAAVRGLPQGVVSNNDGAFVRAVLTGFGLDHHFAAVIGELDMPAPKPDPRGLLLAAERMGRQPGDCIYVGDSGSDATAAHAAGMRSVGVTWGIHTPAQVRGMGFDWVVERPGEIEGLLGDPRL